MLNNYEALSFGPDSCFPTPNRSVSGISHDTSQEQEKGEVGSSLGTWVTAEAWRVDMGLPRPGAAAAVCRRDRALVAMPTTGLDLLRTESAPGLESGHWKGDWESPSSKSRGQL